MQEAPSHKAKAFCSAPETCFLCCCTWCIYQVLTYFEAERSAGLAKPSSTAAVLFPCTTVSWLVLTAVLEVCREFGARHGNAAVGSGAGHVRRKVQKDKRGAES